MTSQESRWYWLASISAWTFAVIIVGLILRIDRLEAELAFEKGRHASEEKAMSPPSSPMPGEN
jgi:hypothetical protein